MVDGDEYSDPLDTFLGGAPVLCPEKKRFMVTLHIAVADEHAAAAVLNMLSVFWE